MSHAVDLPDDLIASARKESAASGRSLSGQIEHWVRLGKKVDALLKPSSPKLEEGETPVKLSECIASIETPAGRERLAAYLQTRPFPHFEPVPGRPRHFLKIDEDGRRTVGRFVERKFVAAD